MTTKPKNDGGRAFPSDWVYYQDPEGKVIRETNPGMTLRDWFAGMAMQGMHASYHDGYPDAKFCAAKAYEQADAMLAERDKP